MKRVICLVLLSAACPLGFIHAQVLPGMPGLAPAPTNSNTNVNMVPGSAADRQTDTQTGLGNMPMADPGSENVAFNGRLWNVANNRLMRSRFETYLTTPEANGPEDQAYRDLMAQITQLLAPTNKPGPDPMKAFALLPEAGTYKIDGGLCNSIAASIWDVWLAQKKQQNLRQANTAMLDRRKQLEWNAEMGMGNAQMAPPPRCWQRQGWRCEPDTAVQPDSADDQRDGGPHERVYQRHRGDRGSHEAE
jgi:hypothetical protein